MDVGSRFMAMLHVVRQMLTESSLIGSRGEQRTSNGLGAWRSLKISERQERLNAAVDNWRDGCYREDGRLGHLMGKIVFSKLGVVATAWAWAS
jgi:hypothetical protein